MAWWPLGRGRRETTGNDSPAAPRPALPLVRPTAGDGAWRDLPGLQRTLAEPVRPVAITDDFRASLAAHTNPSFVAPLSHHVDPSAGGLVDGLVSAGQPQPHRSLAELPVPPRPASASAPRVQRRMEWSGSFDLPSVGWELPGLIRAHPTASSAPEPAPTEVMESGDAPAEPQTAAVPATPAPAGSEDVEIRPPGPPASNEESDPGVARPPVADLPVTRVAAPAPVVSRALDPAAESAPLSGFAAAITSLTGAGPVTSNQSDQAGEEPDPVGPTAGAALQRWPEDVGHAVENESVAARAVQNEPAGISDDDLPTTGLRVQRLAAGAAPQRGPVKTPAAEPQPVLGPPAASTPPESTPAVSTPAGSTPSTAPVSTAPVSTPPVSTPPVSTPPESTSAVPAFAPPVVARSVVARSVVAPPVVVAPSPRPTPVATPRVAAPAGAAPVGTPPPKPTPSVASRILATRGPLPVVSRLMGEVGVRVLDPARSATESMSSDPTAPDRAPDVPTLGPRLSRPPMVVQRIPPTGHAPTPPEPPVQRLAFLNPLGGERRAEPTLPASGGRPPADVVAGSATAPPLRGDSDSTPPIGSAAAVPPRSLEPAAPPTLQRPAPDRADQTHPPDLADLADQDSDLTSVVREPDPLAGPAVSMQRVSVDGWTESDPSSTLPAPAVSMQRVSVDGWTEPDGSSSLPDPAVATESWLAGTSPVIRGNALAPYEPRIGQPSPAVAVGPAIPVQRATHPMESGSGTGSESPLVVSRRAAAPGPSEIGRAAGSMSFAAMFGSAGTARAGETSSAAEDGFTSVQLAPADDAPPPSEPASEPAPPPPASSGAPPAPAGAPPTDLDEMARRLYEPLSARLRAELWLDRERAGVMSDV